MEPGGQEAFLAHRLSQSSQRNGGFFTVSLRVKGEEGYQLTHRFGVPISGGRVIRNGVDSNRAGGGVITDIVNAKVVDAIAQRVSALTFIIFASADDRSPGSFNLLTGFFNPFTGLFDLCASPPAYLFRKSCSNLFHALPDFLNAFPYQLDAFPYHVCNRLANLFNTFLYHAFNFLYTFLNLFPDFLQGSLCWLFMLLLVLVFVLFLAAI